MRVIISKLIILMVITITTCILLSKKIFLYNYSIVIKNINKLKLFNPSTLISFSSL